MGRVRKRLAAERGQGTIEYTGVLSAAAILIIGIVLFAPGVGIAVVDEIRCAVTRVLGGECEGSDFEESCPISNTTSSDTLTAGLSIKVISGSAGLSRVVIKEEFDDGSAVYTVVDRAEFEAALGSRGGGARIGGTQGSLTAALGAFGALESAEIYETETSEQTEAIDEKLSDPGFAENVIRAGGEIGDTVADLPADAACGVGEFLTPFDCPDVRPSDILPNPNEAFADVLFGDQDLPEPDSEYVGGETGVSAFAEAIQDNGGLPTGPGEPEEASAEGEVRLAQGGRVFTDGEREGESEFYYSLDASVEGQFEDSFLGELEGAAEGNVTVTVVVGADGLPKTLRVNATGTLTGAENIDPGAGPERSELDTSELLADSDTGEGNAYEIVAELDLEDPDNLARAAQLLNPNPATVVDGADGVIDTFRDDAEIRVATYGADTESTSSGIDVVVASVEGESEEQRNTLESLYVKPEGSLEFIQTPCGTEGGG